jgi:hypothetical protein
MVADKYLVSGLSNEYEEGLSRAHASGSGKNLELQLLPTIARSIPSNSCPLIENSHLFNLVIFLPSFEPRRTLIYSYTSLNEGSALKDLRRHQKHCTRCPDCFAGCVESQRLQLPLKAVSKTKGFNFLRLREQFCKKVPSKPKLAATSLCPVCNVRESLQGFKLRNSIPAEISIFNLYTKFFYDATVTRGHKKWFSPPPAGS